MDSAERGNTSSGGAQWFESGVKAMEQQNWSYAVDCLLQAVHACPENQDYRKQLHRGSRRRHKHNGGVSKVDNIRLATIRSRMLTADVKKDWKSLDLLAEDALAINPWDASLFAHLATAATHLDNFERAKYAWSSALKLDRNNAAYYRSFGSLLQEYGEFDMARSCFERIQAIDPTGRIADELIKSVEVAALLNQGYTDADNARDVELGRNRPVKDRSPEDVASEVNNDNQRLTGFITLGEQHLKEGNMTSSLEAYRNALKIAPDNVFLKRRMEDVELAWLRQRALEAQTAARQKPDCARTRAFATERLTEVTSRELAVLSKRVAENPDDLVQVFRLADLYRRSNQLDEAIPLFEQVSSDPHLCVEALIGLGECWIRTSRVEQGRIQLENALRLVDPEEKPGSCKLAHYWLGRLYEARRHFEEADYHYGEIMALDTEFRDTARRRLYVYEQQQAAANDDG